MEVQVVINVLYAYMSFILILEGLEFLMKNKKYKNHFLGPLNNLFGLKKDKKKYDLGLELFVLFSMS